jgi:hypothetical protein
MYITTKILAKYGRSDNCPACEGLGPSHSAECRLRIEKAMIEAGEAYQLTNPIRQSEVAVPVEVPGTPLPSPRSSASEGGPLSSTSSSSDSSDDEDKSISPAGMEQLIAIVDKIHGPVVDLWKDPKVKLDDRFHTKSAKLVGK